MRLEREVIAGKFDIIADCQNTGDLGVYDYADAIDDIEINRGKRYQLANL